MSASGLADLIWGSVGFEATSLEGFSGALGVMTGLARSPADVYREPDVLLAQWGGCGSREPGYHVVATCRLDNRAELCTTLGLPDNVPNTRLIVEAYRRWGAESPKHFLGDFAFALWDARAQQLFCARDQLGIIPFYYAQQGSTFCFASDLEGLLACPQVEPKLNLRYVKSFLLYDNEFVDPNYTFFASLFKLPPAHTLTVRGSRLTLSRYWDPTDVPAITLASEEDYVARLRELLIEAVRCRLGAAPPTGAHLSSGLDSSTVAALAARISASPLQTFSWSRPGDLSRLELSHDERREIAVLRATEGLEVHYTDLSETDLLDTFADFTRLPQVHQAMENAVLAKAQRLGVRSLLSGWGGDEGISYYGRAYLSELVLRGRVPELFGQLSGWAALEGKRVWYSGVKRALGLSLPEPLRRAHNRFWETPRALPNCLNPAFRDVLEGVEVYPWHDYLLKSTVKADQAALLTRGAIAYRTEAWHAQATRYGISYLYPLLDRRVVEFALGVPSSLFFRRGQNRYLFRQATLGILPDSIRLKTLKRDPALEEPHYALFDAVMREGKLYAHVAARAKQLEASGYLNVPLTLTSLQEVRAYRAYAQHPSGVSRALWLAFLNPATIW